MKKVGELANTERLDRHSEDERINMQYLSATRGILDLLVFLGEVSSQFETCNTSLVGQN